MNPLLDLEVATLVAGQEWTRQRLEHRAQKEVDQWGGFCPQTSAGLTRRKRQRMKLMTCAGTIVLQTWRGYSTALQRWVNPTRVRWGLQPKQQISPELQSRLGTRPRWLAPMRKRRPPPRAGAPPISDNTVHALVQQLGKQARQLVLPIRSSQSPNPSFPW